MNFTLLATSALASLALGVKIDVQAGSWVTDHAKYIVRNYGDGTLYTIDLD